MSANTTQAAEAAVPPPATGSHDVVGAIDTLVAHAMKALQAYRSFSQEDVDHLVKKASVAALNQHDELATLAVAETGRGVFEDKAVKNIFACSTSPTRWRT